MSTLRGQHGKVSGTATGPWGAEMDSTTASIQLIKASHARVLAKPHRVTPSHRIGRNQPCPCGSGEKFKRCCINKKAEPLFKEN